MLSLFMAATIALSNPAPIITMESTAYIDRGPTKFGGWEVPAGPGVVAVDPKVIEPWSRLYIDGYGEALAVDTGGLIKGYKIDLWMAKKKDALQWGRRQVQVTILRKGRGQASEPSRGSSAVEVYEKPSRGEESAIVTGGYRPRLLRAHESANDFDIGLVHRPREPLPRMLKCHGKVIFWIRQCNPGWSNTAN